MDAYRVVVWGYVSDVVAQLWPDQYDGVCGEIAALVNVANDQEAEVFRIGGPLDESLSDDDLGKALVTYSRGLLAATAHAATGKAVASDNPWLGMAFPVWNECYAEGEEVVAERMRQLAPDGLPTP